MDTVVVQVAETTINVKVRNLDIFLKKKYKKLLTSYKIYVIIYLEIRKGGI